MRAIPIARETDAEDVRWALQTADTLFQRGERADALVWLRRGAQAASDVGDDLRAVELARAAAELSETIGSLRPPPGPPPAGPPGSRAVVPRLDAPSASDDDGIDIEVVTEVGPLDTEPPPFRPVETSPGGFGLEPRLERPSSVMPPPAAVVHAGMFDPWAKGGDAAPASDPDVPRLDDGDDGAGEVVTSVHKEDLAKRLREAREALDAETLPPAARAASAPPPPAPAPREEPKTSRPKAPPPVPKKPAAPPARTAPPLAPESPTRPQPIPPPAVPSFDLSPYDAFADLPDDAREAFAAQGTVHALGEYEETAGFALALVVDGAVDVSATMVDTPALTLAAGQVLRARGTADASVPMRLVCTRAEGAKVVTWPDAAVDEAFRTCPWVEDDLRAASDRAQTLVGVTIGPLGDRLDPELRAQVFSRLEIKSYLPGEVLAEKGKPVPGLFVVGVGSLELVDGERAVGEVQGGEFLFPGEILGGGKAASTARAGQEGALVLFGSRAVAQELLVTCPQLLEIFAGM